MANTLFRDPDALRTIKQRGDVLKGNKRQLTSMCALKLQTVRLSPKSSRTTSDAFSFTMKMGTTIKNPGMRGKTDASTTRRLLTPRTRKRESRAALGSLSRPIGQLHGV